MPLKIIFMGTPEFALPSLESLIKDPAFEVVAVVTKEDKKIGRKQELTAPVVKKMALKYHIPVLQPEKIKDNSDFYKLLKGLEPDFIVVVNYGQILPQKILDLPKYGCINLHPSLLPKYRGTSPYVETLLRGDTESGVSIIQMTAQVDSGDIFLIKKIPIEPEDNALTLGAKLFLLGATMLPVVLKEIVENQMQPVPQNETKASYCGKITKEDGLIDLHQLTAPEIIQHIKAYTPWPSSYIIIHEKRLKILSAAVDMTTSSSPGKVVEIAKNKIGLGTKKGLLIPLFIQLEGRPAMSIESFLAGNKNFFDQTLS